MFYDQLIRICRERNVKPTPLIKSLGLSSGNLKRWQEGATVNSDILIKLADHFKVPIDYFLRGESNHVDIESIPVSNSKGVITRTYIIARNYPDYVSSTLSGREIPYSSLKRIADYLRCSVRYLTGRDNEENDSIPDPTYLSDKELVIDILSRVSADKDYRYMQVMISRIIAENLKRKCILQKDLIGCGINREKVMNLYDSAADSRAILPLTNSDIIRIAHTFKIGYDMIFSGV